MKRVLFVYSRKASFVAIDRGFLAERFEIDDLYQPGRWPNPLTVVRGVLRADLVFGWFASWHTFLPIGLAWLLRKPSVLIIGGFDTANMPDIGYGHQRGGLRAHASRWLMKRATRLITNSNYSLSEIERNTPIPPERVTVVHHGVPDPFGALPEGERDRRSAHGGRDRPHHARPEGPAPVRRGGALTACNVKFVFIDGGSTGGGDDVPPAPDNVGSPSSSRRGPARLVPPRRRLRAGLAPRGLRHGGGRGDARRLRAGGDGRDRDAGWWTAPACWFRARTPRRWRTASGVRSRPTAPPVPARASGS